MLPALLILSILASAIVIPGSVTGSMDLTIMLAVTALLAHAGVVKHAQCSHELLEGSAWGAAMTDASVNSDVGSR